MINLIPFDAQKQVVREYWVRVVSVGMFLLGSGFLIVALLNAPVYVLVRSQLSSYLSEYNEASNQSDSFKAAQAQISQTNDMALLLSKSSASTPFSSVMSKLESLTGNEITIDSYKFTRKNALIDSIEITGMARSRVALSKFKDDLQNDKEFQKVDLPLSNLAKDKDIPFTIMITPNAKP
jgi:hypothetical protein